MSATLCRKVALGKSFSRKSGPEFQANPVPLFQVCEGDTGFCFVSYTVQGPPRFLVPRVFLVLLAKKHAFVKKLCLWKENLVVQETRCGGEVGGEIGLAAPGGGPGGGARMVTLPGQVQL